ncbi:MAG: peptide chain release factor N(5)-glutamine methyltransferase, partial [Amylibacter sp.]
MQTIEQLLKWGIGQLKPILHESTATDVRVLMAYALDVDRGLLGAKLEHQATSDQIACFKAAIGKRIKRQPVSQIIGVREFWGRDFVVTPDVL